MSEYKLRHDPDGGYALLEVLSPDGTVLLGSMSELDREIMQKTVDLLNEEMAAYAERITALQIENARIAELEAALEQIQYTVNHVHCMQIAAAALKKAGGNE